MGRNKTQRLRSFEDLGKALDIGPTTDQVETIPDILNDQVQTRKKLDRDAALALTRQLFDAAQEKLPGPRLTKNQQTMFAILHDAGGFLSKADWYERAHEAGLGRKRQADLHDFRSALVAKWLVYETAGGFRVRHSVPVINTAYGKALTSKERVNRLAKFMVEELWGEGRIEPKIDPGLKTTLRRQTTIIGPDILYPAPYAQPLALSVLAALLAGPSVREDEDVKFRDDATLEAMGRAVLGECLASHPSIFTLKASKKRGGFLTRQWSVPDIFKAGAWAMSCCLIELKDVFVREDGETRVCPEAVDEAKALAWEAMLRNPKFVPCTSPPAPWTGLRDGGYWTEGSLLSAQLARSHHPKTLHAIDRAISKGSMQRHLDGLHALQSTEFVINREVLSLIEWCHEAKSIRPPVMVPWRKRPYARDGQRKKGKRSSMRWVGTGEDIVFGLEQRIAHEMADAEQFYIPQSRDFRGRAYAESPYFGFGEGDRVRSLFLFKRAMPLGVDGLRELKIHVANMAGGIAGVSRRPYDERVRWAEDHVDDIIRKVADDPRGTVEIWNRAGKKKRFQFVAGCRELWAALQLDDPTKFESRLPVIFDCSCSGLQHIAAMMLSPEGQYANLLPMDEPQDIYSIIADQVIDDNFGGQAVVPGRVFVKRYAWLDADNSATWAEHVASAAKQWAKLGEHVASAAKQWAKLGRMRAAVQPFPSDPTSKRKGRRRKVRRRKDGTISPLPDTYRAFELPMKVDRALLKVIIVAYFYGSSRPGMQGALTKHIRKETHRRPDKDAMHYLVGLVWDTIEKLLKSPRQVMTFLEGCAEALACQNRALSWTSPSGWPLQNRYHPPDADPVQFHVAGKRTVRVLADGFKPEIAVGDAVKAVAANVVHCCDASLFMLVAGAAKRKGIDITGVHDAFACHAANAGRVRKIVRDQFFNMHDQHNVLDEIRKAAAKQLRSDKNLPALPERGTLDLKQVLNSPYFTH
jgi:Autographiviridae RNA polymerase